MISFTYGTTPVDTIRQALPDFYTMELVGDAADVVRTIVNQGIDSHLEACNMPTRGDRYEWLPADSRRLSRRLACRVSRESMIVLLRRLEEYQTQHWQTDEEEEENREEEEAMSLRTDILGQLGIEEI
jgi:hypothetical protein